MVGGLILVPIVSFITRKTVPSDVEDIFICYKDTKTVGITDSLGE